MNGEHAEPTPQLQDLRHHLEEPEAIRPTDVTSVAKLLAELRHLLENGCTLSTALDVVDEAQAAVQTMSRAGGAQGAAFDGTESLNLVELLNRALNEYACSIAESNIVVLNRKSARRMVRARKAELSALLEEVVHIAIQCCTAVPAPRILRFRIHNDHRDVPCLILEHSTTPAAVPKPVLRRALGVEVTQDHERGTIVLAFQNLA